MRRALFLFVALTACNALIGLKEPQVHDEADAAPAAFRAYTSGTRLRAEVWDVDGVRMLHGWYDTTRQEECTFERSGDSTKPRHCLPTDAADVTAFDDPACTHPVDPTTPPKTYAVLRPPHACDGPPTVYTHGALVPITQLYTGMPGACTLQQNGPAQAYALDVVPLDAFASARETVEERGGRIASLVLVTDDGAREVIGGYDKDRKEPSWVPGKGWPGVQDPTWSPSRFAWHYPKGLREFFADPGCTSAIAASYLPRVAACPFTAVIGDPPVSAIGGPLDASIARTRDEDGGCVLVSQLGYDFIYFDIGDPVDTTTLAPATSVKLGDGRVRVVFDATDVTGPIAPPIPVADDPILTRSNFFDTALDDACDLKATADGLTRCLPTATAQLVYSDAACTQPAAQLYQDPIPAAALLQLDASHYAVHKIGPKIGDAYYTRSGSACQRVGGPCFSLGDDISAQFEVVTDVRE